MKSTEELINTLNNSDDLDTLLEDVPGISFSKYLNELVYKYNVSIKDIAANCTLNTSYVYHIFGGKKTNPGRDKVLCIALTMGLSVDETNHLLSLSDNGDLYIKNYRDATILFALKHHYSVVETNILLEQKGYEELK